MPNPQDSCWTTAKEIRFVDSLGSHHKSEEIPDKTRLRRYIAGANKRVNWGRMNREEILRHAEMKLARIGS